MVPAGLPAAIATENCDHENNAPARVTTSSSAVLLTVPLRVIGFASRTSAPLPASRKVSARRAGLPLRMRFPLVGRRMPRDEDSEADAGYPVRLRGVSGLVGRQG